MLLIIARMALKTLVWAMLVNNSSILHGQETQYRKAVLDVEAVMQAMPSLQKGLAKIQAERDSLARGRDTVDGKSVSIDDLLSELNKREAKIRFDAYQKMTNVVRALAAKNEVNLVTLVQNSDFNKRSSDEMKTSQSLEQVEKLIKNEVVYQNQLNFTRMVIRKLTKTSESANSKTFEDEGRQQLTAILDVEKVMVEMTAFQKQLAAVKAEIEKLDSRILSKIGDANESEKAMFREQRSELAVREAKLTFSAYCELESAVKELAETHEISTVIRTDTQDVDRTNLDQVNKAIKRTVVFHRNLDLTRMVIKRINDKTRTDGASLSPKKNTTEKSTDLNSTEKVFHFTIAVTR
ncbi:MAG: hypothetical protein AB8B55_00635 [Mariniblastus sp.]